MMKRMERAVAEAIGEAPPAADWPAERRARTALMLTNAYVGLRVLARSGVSAKDLAAVIRTAMEGSGLAEGERP
jgi:hypothetical protein